MELHHVLLFSFLTLTSSLPWFHPHYSIICRSFLVKCREICLCLSKFQDAQASIFLLLNSVIVTIFLALRIENSKEARKHSNNDLRPAEHGTVPHELLAPEPLLVSSLGEEDPDLEWVFEQRQDKSNVKKNLNGESIDEASVWPAEVNYEEGETADTFGYHDKNEESITIDMELHHTKGIPNEAAETGNPGANVNFQEEDLSRKEMLGDEKVLEFKSTSTRHSNDADADGDDRENTMEKIWMKIMRDKARQVQLEDFGAAKHELEDMWCGREVQNQEVGDGNLCLVDERGRNEEVGDTRKDNTKEWSDEKSVGDGRRQHSTSTTTVIGQSKKKMRKRKNPRKMGGYNHGYGDDVEGEELRRKAEEFIARFYAQIRAQRQPSLQRRTSSSSSTMGVAVYNRKRTCKERVPIRR